MYINNLKQISLNVTPLAITYVFYVSFSVSKELIKINYPRKKALVG